MVKTNCHNCRKSFEKESEDRTKVCEACDKKQRSEIELFKTVKTVLFSFALMVLSLLIPLSLAKETSPGYYVMPAKSNPIQITGSGITISMFVIVILSIAFSIVGFWFKSKQEEREADYQNDGLTIK